MQNKSPSPADEFLLDTVEDEFIRIMSYCRRRVSFYAIVFTLSSWLYSPYHPGWQKRRPQRGRGRRQEGVRAGTGSCGPTKRRGRPAGNITSSSIKQFFLINFFLLEKITIFYIFNHIGWDRFQDLDKQYIIFFFNTKHLSRSIFFFNIYLKKKSSLFQHFSNKIKFNSTFL